MKKRYLDDKQNPTGYAQVLEEKPGISRRRCSGMMYRAGRRDLDHARRKVLPLRRPRLDPGLAGRDRPGPNPKPPRSSATTPSETGSIPIATTCSSTAASRPTPPASSTSAPATTTPPPDGSTASTLRRPHQQSAKSAQIPLLPRRPNPRARPTGQWNLGMTLAGMGIVASIAAFSAFGPKGPWPSTMESMIPILAISGWDAYTTSRGQLLHRSDLHCACGIGPFPRSSRLRICIQDAQQDRSQERWNQGGGGGIHQGVEGEMEKIASEGVFRLWSGSGGSTAAQFPMRRGGEPG